MWFNNTHPFVSLVLYKNHSYLHRLSPSFSLSTEEPKLVQRKSHLFFIYIINMFAFVSPLCVGLIGRHAGDSTLVLDCRTKSPVWVTGPPDRDKNGLKRATSGFYPDEQNHVMG